MGDFNQIAEDHEKKVEARWDTHDEATTRHGGRVCISRLGVWQTMFYVVKYEDRGA